MPELEFLETPVGMIYMGTRRVGQNVWARMVEAVLPNLQQIAPIWETGHQEHAFSGPMLSRWVVPQDDTNTMFIELRHVSDTEGDTRMVGRSHDYGSLDRCGRRHSAPR